jgi:polysaccharide biosynthesis protein PslG
MTTLDARDTDNPFGMLAFLDWNHDWNDHMYDSPQKLNRAVELMRQAGVGMTRQIISWDEVEPSQGRFEFRKYDQILNLLDQNRIRTLGILAYTASWTQLDWNDLPDTDLFLQYVRQVVRRYKSRVKYWEVWNEPDQKMYWKKQDASRSYVALLKRVHDVVKEEDPTAMVVLGSANTAGPIKEIYDAGAKNHFDIISLHPFMSPLKSDALHRIREIFDDVRKIQAGYQDLQTPIWFTELGCPGVVDPSTSKGWWEGKTPNLDEQAGWVRTIYNETLQWPGLQKIFWAFLQDSNHFHDDIDAFGLVNRDFSRKPAFDAYQQLAHAWKSTPA